MWAHCFNFKFIPFSEKPGVSCVYKKADLLGISLSRLTNGRARFQACNRSRQCSVQTWAIQQITIMTRRYAMWFVSLLTIGNTMHYNALVKPKRVAEKVRLNSLCITYILLRMSFVLYLQCYLTVLLRFEIDHKLGVLPRKPYIP